MAKTSKVIVLHEDTHTSRLRRRDRGDDRRGGVRATSTRPVVRVTAPDTPVPFSPPLEKAFLPQVEDVVAGDRETVRVLMTPRS